MSALRKLAGQTAIYGLCVLCQVVLVTSCSSSEGHDLKGRWRAWLVHGMGERELAFLDGGIYTNTIIDSTGSSKSDVDKGSYAIVGDSILLTPHYGSPIKFALHWKTEHQLLLVLDSSTIALERLQQ